MSHKEETRALCLSAMGGHEEKMAVYTQARVHNRSQLCRLPLPWSPSCIHRVCLSLSRDKV